MRVPSQPHVRANATYAPAGIGIGRYSRTELADLRRPVKLLFAAPQDSELTQLVREFERIYGRVPRPNQLGYLIRLYRIHGPATRGLLVRLYLERASTENLLLAVEMTPPGWADDQVEADPPAARTDEPPVEPAGPTDEAGVVPPWHCYSDLGSGHVQTVRPDGSSYCGTCYP
jgi:hypothetical protein